MPKVMKARLEISSSINKIRERIGTIRSREDLDIQNIDKGEDPARESLLARRRRDACEENEQNDVVGLEKEINTLVKRLIEGETRRCVISVVGQAGLGKTVLARNVYNRVKSSFISAAWIHLSKLKTKEVLKELCTAVLSLPGDKIGQQNEEDMRASIQKELKEMKYLVVLDDVWTPEAWDAVRGALPDGNTVSRVLMTTRDVGVAKHADLQTDPYMLPLLNEKDSHELFRKNAFPTPPHSCPHELKSLATQIVQKSGGLPLALVNLGAILSKKEPTARTWKHVVAGLDWELNKGEIASILDLSFDYLTSDLKSCLLYCCAFPGNFEIRVRRLLRQWIAEGFVQKQGRRRLEEVAMDYLVESVERSLIQPCKRNSFGQIKSCRVHDVLLQMLVTTAEEQNFFRTHSAADGHHDLSNCRRLAVHHNCLQQRTQTLLRLTRSFISFQKSEAPTCYDLVENFKLLKVLDLEGVRGVKKLPNEIGDLVLLRYLGLRNTSIETLPRSIKQLHNLQTLDLRTSANVSLSPSKIPLKYFKAKHLKYMTSLRHLYFGNRRHENFNAMEVPDDFGAKGALKELQTLSYVKAGGWVGKGLPTMTSLDDPLLGLQTLQSLKSLRLVNNAYNGKTMGCLKDGFPNLEVLNIEHLDSLADIHVESGAFPQLKYMRIASCNNLVEIPEGLGTMGILKELKR
ncbi:putative disease resistance RPP13-like protein 3 [Nymphaea colorata]|nr:putative disease resistance RPP13-like protein 3 [Nymphaea colorata]